MVTPFCFGFFRVDRISFFAYVSADLDYFSGCVVSFENGYGCIEFFAQCGFDFAVCFVGNRGTLLLIRTTVLQSAFSGNSNCLAFVITLAEKTIGFTHKPSGFWFGLNVIAKILFLSTEICIY